MARRERKPNIEALVRKKDVEGLVEAASYRELVRTSPETGSDVGIPVRAEAILALGELDAEVGRDAVALGLRDPADYVRCAAVRVLHGRREVSVLAQALRWLPADKGHSRRLASQAVLDLRTIVSLSAVANALIARDDDDLLGEEDGELIVTLLEGAEAGAVAEAIELLVSALGDERGIVADRASEMLVRLAPASTEALLAELHTGSADAAYVLGRIGDPQTLDALVKGLRHKDARVRAESAAALAELQDPAAVKPLLRATHDPEHIVRNQAGLALDRLGTIAVIEGVAALLRPVVREAIRSAVPQPEIEADRRAQPQHPPTRTRSRARPSNGGPP
jgi:HEAT repeat protein